MCINIWFVFFSSWLISLCIKALGSSISVQFSSVAQSCPTLCDPMDCSMPGLPVHHQLLECTQTHVHWVGDAIHDDMKRHHLSSTDSTFFPFYGCVIFHWIYVPQLLYSFLSGPLGCFHDRGGEGGRFNREGICMRFWVFHMYGRKQHNIVKQLSSNEI